MFCALMFFPGGEIPYRRDGIGIVVVVADGNSIHGEQVEVLVTIVAIRVQY